MHDRARLHLVRAQPEDHREGVRALRLRAEPRPDRASRVRDVLGRARAGVPGPGQGVHGQRRRLRRRDATSPPWSRGMNALTEERADRRGRAAPRDRGPRPGDRQPLHQGPPGHGDPRRPQLPRRQADPHRRPAPHPRPEGRPADRRAAEHPHPQDPRRPGDRPVLAGAARDRAASRCRACTRRARRPASAAAACTATARWRAPSSAAASSPGRTAGRAAAQATG